MRTIAYLGDYTALTTTKYGDKIYVDTRDTSLAPHLLVEGDWEPWVTNAMRSVLSRIGPGFTFIDVGANFGWYTLLAHRMDAHSVVAIEPNPRLFELLRKTVAVNGRIGKTGLMELAATATVQRLFLEFTWDELGGGRLVEDATRSHSRVVPVSGVPLDTVIPYASTLPPRVVIKIDVEGGEVDVLRGASKILDLGPILFVEHHQENTAALWELLGSRYTIHLAKHDGHRGAALSLSEALDIPNAETLICLPVTLP
jgi:FkbM family methyltransferase